MISKVIQHHYFIQYCIARYDDKQPNSLISEVCIIHNMIAITIYDDISWLWKVIKLTSNCAFVHEVWFCDRDSGHVLHFDLYYNPSESLHFYLTR